MKNRSLLPGLFLLGAALSVALVACQPKTTVRVTVKTGSVSTGTLVRSVDFSGVLVPDRTVNIYAKLAGQATFVGGDVGDHVKAGQLLVQIDTKELNAQLKVAEAQLAGVSDQAAQAKIGVETARLNLDLAQRAYDRTKTLFETKVVTQSQLDDAQTKLDLAKSAFDNASRQYETVSGSGVAQADAQVNYIRVQISNSTITSPIAGVVTNRNINVGEITSVNTVLMSIADTATLKLQGNLSQEDIVHLSIGDRVKVSVDAIPGKQYAGRIEQVGPIAAATGQYFPVVLTLANDGKLLAGMTAKASFTLTGASGTIAPLAAVDAGEDGQAFVYLVAGGKVHKTQVVLGMRNATDVQVLSGLAPGDTVAISNIASLQDGMEVAQ
ncbi:MAG TPA: efflux RND transporter periplasmic adaptor subunit [Spirochaetia bacterium]|nr:efflux RND transporter periplasmic adaptor subunit [Spirochaetia bacterium]